MAERKLLSWKMRTYYVCAILFLVFVQSPATYVIGSMLTLDDPPLWIYMFSVTGAVLYLGRFWWFFPCVFLPYFLYLYNIWRHYYGKYGQPEAFNGVWIVFMNDIVNIGIVILYGFVFLCIRNWVIRRWVDD